MEPKQCRMALTNSHVLGLNSMVMTIYIKSVFILVVGGAKKIACSSYCITTVCNKAVPNAVMNIIEQLCDYMVEAHTLYPPIAALCPSHSTSAFL